MSALHDQPSDGGMGLQPAEAHDPRSLATVYRNLAMFKAEGTIDSVGVYHGLERFDFRTDPHAHFICRVCGAVSDINWFELPADTLQEVEQQTGASVETCRIAVSGVCAACMKKDTQ